MKRLFVLLIAIVGMALPGLTQNVFTFEAPKFQKFVKVIGSNVNIRKQPSSQGRKVYVAEKDKILAVVGESGEWYQVCTSYWDAPYALEGGNETIEMTVVGYIMKKYCKEFKLSHLEEESSNFGLMQRKNGRYKDICIYTTYSGHEENWYGLSLMIGKKVGDIVLLPYRIIVEEYANPSNRIEFKREENEYQIAFCQDLIDGMEISFDKFTDADIDYLLNNVSKMAKNSGKVVFRLNGDEVENIINYGSGLNQIKLIKY